MLYKTQIKNLRPFYKPAGDDDSADINAMLFGDLPDDSESEDEAAAKVPSFDAIDGLGGDDLDAALAAMLAADNEEKSSVSEAPSQTEEEESSASEAPAQAEEENIWSDSPDPGEDLFMDESADESMGGTDIDALLAALGSGDDTEALSGTNPLLEDELKSAEPGNEADPDDVLQHMIDMDQKADADFIPQDMGAASQVKDGIEWTNLRFDPDADPSLIDESARAAAMAAVGGRRRLKIKKKIVRLNRLSHMSMMRFMTVSVVILVIILGSGFWAAASIRRVYAARIEEAMTQARFIQLVQPENVANYSHFVNLNEVASVDGREFFLRRISFGQHGTHIHFADIFDPGDYIFVLFDQDGNLFMRLTQDFEYGLPRQRGTTLQFGPLLPTTREITLHIQGQNEAQAFYFILENGPEFPAAVYVNNPVPLVEGIEDRFLIVDAVFSNTGSEIVYMIRHDPARGSMTYRREDIRMREGGRNPAANRLMSVHYDFPEHNRTLGRITFGPVRNLDMGVSLNFMDLFTSYPMPNRFLDLPALFRNSPEYEQVIPVGGYHLVLERMGIQGPFVIVVLHAHDENGRRVQTELVATLVIETSDGPVVIEGQNFFSERYVGTDLFFDTRAHEVSVIRAGDLQLEIEAIEIHLDEARVSFYLDEQDMQPASRRVDAERDIEGAFVSRLAYRAGILAFEGIRGFSADVLDNRAVMRHYSPVTVPMGETRAMFDARVVAGAFVEDNVFLAVVEEEWMLEDEGVFSVIRDIHRVTARLTEGRWVVTGNHVIG